MSRWEMGTTRQNIITGTGFPRVFYLAYDMYRQYFPLLALTTYRRAMERAVKHLVEVSALVFG